MKTRDDIRRANKRLVRNLAMVAVAMFAFGFALSPLYDVFCRVTGLNGKTGQVDAQDAAATRVDTSRRVTVEFTGHASTGLPWEFRPLRKKIEVHPGASTVVKYYVRNTANETITGQAIPSVTPGRAAEHFKKIECFCFSRQALKAGEVKEMPVQFVVNPELPVEVQTITLSYAFFNSDKASAKKYGGDDVAPDHDHRIHAHARTASSGG